MEELEKVNRFTRRPMTGEEVYLFDVILCDNDIDRDMEAFSEKSLEQLQGLFIGKTGIFDHDPRSGGQTARLFDACIVREPGKKTRDGRPYAALKGRAYMIRTGGNADLIREIDGGIKKEVSVSCSAARRICSVCGGDMHSCGHRPGMTYGSKTCHTILEDITDAYEWSFVAVPAQMQAGVTKMYREADTMETNETLEKQTKLLHEVEKALRREVLQLCQKDGSGCIPEALCLAADKMDLEELMVFKSALLEDEKCEAQVQLSGNVESFRC